MLKNGKKLEQLDEQKAAYQVKSRIHQVPMIV